MPNAIVSEERPELDHPPCPKCSTPMNVLMFLDAIPDGWVCVKCKTWYAADDQGKPKEQPLAMVL